MKNNYYNTDIPLAYVIPSKIDIASSILETFDTIGCVVISESVL